MKKYVLLFLLIYIGFVCFGCSGKKTADAKVTATPEPATKKETTSSATVKSSKPEIPDEKNTLGETFNLEAKKNKVLFVFIRPSNLFSSEEEKALVDGKTRTIIMGKELVAFYVEPGRQHLFSQTGTTPAIKAKFKEGNTYYFYNPDDAKSQEMLGDLLYEKENFKGSLGAYRQAAKLDSTLTGFYKRYAKIVITHGKVDEIEKVMKRLIALGHADATTFLGLGKVYQKRKLYSKAVIQFENCLGLEPDNGEAMISLADCKAKLGQTDASIDLFEKAIRLDPSSPDEYKTLGDLYTKQKQLTKATQAYKAFLDKGGKNNAIAQLVGNQSFARSNYKEAAKYLVMVKGEKAKSATHCIKLGESYYHAGEYGKAVPKLKASLKYGLKTQRQKQVMLLLAESYDKSNEGSKALYWYNRYAKLVKSPGPNVSYKQAFLREKTRRAEAITIYEKNITRFPNDYRNFLRLGILYSKKKATLSKSAVMLKKAVRLADTLSSAWIEIAQVYGKLDRSNDELAAYKKYLSFDPDNMDAHVRVGIILIEKGKITEGMPYLEKAYKKKPKNVSVIISLATGYQKKGNNEKALELLSKAKKLKPQDVEVRKSIATIYKNTGKPDEALNEMKELIALKPSNAARIEYAKLLHQQGKLDEAINAIEDVRAVDPENIIALMIIGEIYQDQKKYVEALEIYKEIAFIDNNNAVAIYKQADVYLAQSKLLWAEKYYKNALAKNPKLGLAVFGQAKVAKLRKNNALYKKYLTRAYRLSPNEPEIKEAYQKK